MGSILGNRVQRVEDPRMLTVGGTYVEDVPIEAAWVHFVRSEFAHGRILSYEVDDAKKVPGVLGVFTGEDLDLPPFPHVQPILEPGSERPLIAKGTVRFVGEPVVAVVAVDRHTAVDAGCTGLRRHRTAARCDRSRRRIQRRDARASGTRHQHLRDVHVRAPGRLLRVRGRARSAGGQPADRRLADRAT